MIRIFIIRIGRSKTEVNEPVIAMKVKLLYILFNCQGHIGLMTEHFHSGNQSYTEITTCDCMPIVFISGHCRPLVNLEIDKMMKTINWCE